MDQALDPFIKRGDIKVVMDREVTDWDPDVAERIVLEALDQAAKDGIRIDAIVAPNDGAAGGVAKALTARGLSGKIPVTGHDGDSTAAERIMPNGRTKVQTILISPVLVDKDNIKKELYDSGYITRETTAKGRQAPDSS